MASEIEKRFYLAEGLDEKTVRNFFQERLDALDAASDLAKEYGGKAVTQGRSMVGVAFDGEFPKGWRRAGSTGSGQSYYIPDARSKAGKEAKMAIHNIRIPGAMEIDSRLGGPGGVMADAGPRGGYWMFFITAEIIDGKCIIHVPEKCDFEPKHSKPLKKSDYWKMKEAASDKAAAQPHS